MGVVFGCYGLANLTTPFRCLRDLSSVTERVSFLTDKLLAEFAFHEMATIGPSWLYEEDRGSDDEMNMSSEDEEELLNLGELELDFDRGRLSKGA